MKESISSDLVKYEKIILSLVPYAKHPKLDTLIAKLTQGVLAKVRFTIKMEIMRLAKPCNIILDFRPILDNCKQVHHLSTCHYLDDLSENFFESVEKIMVPIHSRFITNSLPMQESDILM